MKVSAGDLSTALGKILVAYGDDVTEATRRLVKRAGNEAGSSRPRRKTQGSTRKAGQQGNTHGQHLEQKSQCTTQRSPD